MTMTREEAAVHAADAIAALIVRGGGTFGELDVLDIAYKIQKYQWFDLSYNEGEICYLRYDPSPNGPAYNLFFVQGRATNYAPLTELKEAIGEDALAVLKLPEDTVQNRIWAAINRWWHEWTGENIPDHAKDRFPRAIKRGYAFVHSDKGYTIVVGQKDPLGYVARVFHRVGDMVDGRRFVGSAILHEQSSQASAYVEEALQGQDYPGTTPAPTFTDEHDTAYRIGAIVRWLWAQEIAYSPYPAAQHDEFVAKLRAGAAASMFSDGNPDFTARIIVDLPDERGFIARLHERQRDSATEIWWKPFRYSTEIFSKAIEQHVGREAVLALLGAK